MGRFLSFKLVLGVFVLLFVASSCAYQKEYSRVSRKGSLKEKYEFAMNAYEQKHYRKAQDLFEGILPSFRGREGMEDIVYKLAYSYFYQRDFYMSAYYFKMLGRLFPTSKLVEETAYMSAYCKYLEAPYYKLEQSSTREAIKQFQLFINYYPSSPMVDSASVLIDEMRAKLSLKAYELSNMYYKRKLYNAASISFYNYIRDYPESIYREEAAFKMLKSRFLYADNSVRDKQKERFQKVFDAYEIFMRSYSDGKYAKEAVKYIENTHKKLKKYGL